MRFYLDENVFIENDIFYYEDGSKITEIKRTQLAYLSFKLWMEQIK